MPEQHEQQSERRASVPLAERDLRLLLETLSDFAVFTIDRSGTILNWNAGAQAVFGYTENEVVGKNFSSLFTPEDVAAGAPEHEIVVAAENGTAEDERWHLKKGGIRFYASGVLRKFGDHDGFFMKVARDITARRRTEIRLHTEQAVSRVLSEPLSPKDCLERVLRTLVDSLGVQWGGLWLLNDTRDKLVCASTALSGTDPTLVAWDTENRSLLFDPAVGLPGHVWETRNPAWVRDIASDPNFPRAPMAIAAGFRSGWAFPVARGDQRFGVMEFLTTALTEPDADLLITMHAIGNQVGQYINRLAAERALAESEARKTAMLESALDGIITIGHDGKILELNAAAAEMFGYTREELIGKELATSIIPPSLRQAHRTGLKHYLETGHGPILDRRIEVSAMCKDGTLISIELAITRIRSPGLPMFTGYLRDITSRRVMDEELQRSRRQLEDHARQLERLVAQRTATLQESLDALEGVLYHVAHDLRGPLRAIQGFTSILADDYASRLDAAGKQLAQRISTAAIRMDRLIADLLEYGRLGHVELKLAPVDLNQPFSDALEDLADLIRAKEATVLCEQPLPKAMAHPFLVERVLKNLIENGIKFVAPGTKPVVSLSSKRTDAKVQVFIRDNGIGISPEHHERVFRVFERLYGPEYAGTGIGLAIVRKSVERMGGNVGLESIPGGGTTFWIELPAAAE